MSFKLVSMAEDLVSPHTAVAHGQSSAVARPLSAPLAKPDVIRRSPRRGATIATTARSKDE